MSDWGDLLLLAVLVADLFIVATSRLGACVKTTALQGLALALLPIALVAPGATLHVGHLALMSGGTLVIKAIGVPWLLMRTIRRTGIRREVEPFVSLHTSVMLGAILVGLAFWLSRALSLPKPAPSTLLVPVAFATILLGFLVVVSRKKAVTQVVGYLMMENGIFIFGQAIAGDTPWVVELGLFLDLLVGVFVFGITIHHISREFDHIDVDALATLKD